MGRMFRYSKLKRDFFQSKWIADRTPQAKLKWESEGVSFGEEWNSIYRIPFNITRSTKLQSLQYRINHRYFPTRRFLCIRGVLDDPFCNECGTIETIKHYFVDCHELKQFWREVIGKINKKVKPCHRFIDNADNIIFGNLKTSAVANLILLIAKQFIVNRRFKEERICWDDFLPCLTRHYCMEKIIAAKEDRIDTFKDRWKPFVSEALQINI